ncbi:hypothetical protein HDU92_000333 [Lobulomyces angularis]|nr:hypothetical protein HDU92_000333 [Lobulomyces angularis]
MDKNQEEKFPQSYVVNEQLPQNEDLFTGNYQQFGYGNLNDNVVNEEENYQYTHNFQHPQECVLVPPEHYQQEDFSPILTETYYKSDPVYEADNTPYQYQGQYYPSLSNYNNTNVQYTSEPCLDERNLGAATRLLKNSYPHNKRQPLDSRSSMLTYGQRQGMQNSNATIIPPYSLVQKKNKNRICCCLGVTLYFLYPRTPEIVVSKPYLNADLSGGSSVKVVGSPLTASVENPFVLTFFLFLDVAVNSKNLIDWDLNYIKVVGTVINPDGTEAKGLDGLGTVNNVKIKKLGVTNLTLPIVLNYTVTSASNDMLKEPTLRNLLNSCGFFSSEAPPDIKLQYSIFISVGIISWTGYIPQIDGTTDFACPVNKNDLGIFKDGQFGGGRL